MTLTRSSKVASTSPYNFLSPSDMKSFFTLLLASCAVLGKSVPKPKPNASSRMNKITSMYGWEGFVYDLEVCVPPLGLHKLLTTM